MQKLKIYYCFDPFCGWCYAFGDNLLQIEKEFESTVDIEVISGGMIVGKNVPKLSEMSEYILHSIPQVEEKSNVKFGEPFIKLLKEGSYQPQSLPPSISISVYKSLFPSNSLQFAHDIQKSYFVNGEDILSSHYYTGLAVRHKINPNQFMERWSHPEYKIKTENEFVWTRKRGVQSFPCIIGKAGEDFQLISKGFIEKDVFKTALEKWITETKMRLN